MATAGENRTHAPGLDFGKVVLALQKLGIAQNAVEGGAQFVGHRRQKVAFGLAGRLCRGLFLLQGLRPFPLRLGLAIGGHIVDDALKAHHFALGVPAQGCG